MEAEKNKEMITLGDLVKHAYPVEIKYLSTIARAICIALDHQKNNAPTDTTDPKFIEGYAMAVGDLLGAKGMPVFVEDIAVCRADRLLAGMYDRLNVKATIQTIMQRK